LIAKLAPTLGQEIAHQTEVIRQQLLADFGNIPAGQKGVDSVHERGIVFHLGWHGAKQVPDALLMFNINIKVANQDDATIGSDAFLATAEFTGLHVPLHDVHAILLVERDAGHLVEADHIVLADQSALAGCVVDEHPGNRGLTSRNQMRIRRNLLEEMALPCSSGAEFHQVVVTLDKGNHSQHQGVMLPPGQSVRLYADGSK